MSLKHIEIYFLRYMPVYCRLTPVWDISSLSSLASFRDYSKATRVRHARGLWILIRIHGFEHFTCLFNYIFLSPNWKRNNSKKNLKTWKLLCFVNQGFLLFRNMSTPKLSVKDELNPGNMFITLRATCVYKRNRNKLIMYLSLNHTN